MSTQRPTHCPQTQFESRQGELLIHGEPIRQLAQRVGQTPFYAYDASVMARQVEAFRAAIPPQIHLHYAMKANPMREVVKFMAERVDGLDIASGGELEVALAAGVDPATISFAGPGKSTPELRASVEAGVTINLESFTELDRVTQLGEELNTRPRVAVRVNPDFELKASGMKMAGGSKPFGVDAERVPELLTLIGRRGLHFRGFHIFSGSQNLKPEAIIEAHDKTFELALRLADSAPAIPEILNIGGGFGIPYFPGEKPLDLEPIGANLRAMLPEIRQSLPDTEIVIELGRFLVGPAGVYVCEVVDVKDSRSQRFAITNGGLHHHLSASGNFGQVIRKNYPVAVANKMNAAASQEASVVGPLCTPLDILADKMPLPEIEIGDLIAVFQSGAYGYSASPHLFLSHPAPLEILV